MVKLKKVLENTIDDISSIESNIEALSNRFINPIDRMRSISKPAPIRIDKNKPPVAGESDAENEASNAFEGLQINPSRRMESRAHAFYRMLGFQVMDHKGTFYSSGFDPNRQNQFFRIIVNDNISNGPLQNIINLRETQVEERRLKFAAQNNKSMAYTLALRHVKPFLVMDRNKGPLVLDNQSFEISARDDELTEFTVEADTGESFLEFIGGQHILKPFTIDPRIEKTVMPNTNLVCAPFLSTTEDTQLSTGVKLLRPGIEYIIRVRLQDPGLDEEFALEAQRALKGSTADDEATASTIRDAALAIAGESNIDDSNILDALSGLTTVQTATITSLVKTIKSVVKRLDESIASFDLGIIKFSLKLVPGVEGPEGSGGFSKTVGIGTISQLDSKIAQLKLEQQLELTRGRLGINGGSIDSLSSLFATPVPIIATVKRDFNGEIQKLTRTRDGAASLALQDIANIERITGEVSGLGLIDVLAIYTALWAIDINTLLGFLDDAAIRRLSESDLQVPEINTKSGEEVLADFEKKLFNILSFADTLFKNRRNPRKIDSGDGTQG